MKNYPKEFYATEKKPLHIAGYTLALGLMAIGVAETGHGLYYQFMSEGGNLWLGPLTLVAAGITAWVYLKEAKVVY